MSDGYWSNEDIQRFLQNLSNYRNLSEQLYNPVEIEYTFDNVTKIFFYILTMSIGLLSNGLLIYVVVSTKSLRTKFNVYIVNLAVADLLVITFCSWVHLMTDITQNWILGATVCKISTFVQVTVVSASILTLTTSVVDRYLAAKHPQYLGLTQRCQTIVILAVWTCALVTALPWLLYTKQVQFHWATGLEVDCQDIFPSQTIKKAYITVFATVFYALPLGTMFYLLVLILKVPTTQCLASDQEQCGQSGSLEDMSQSQSDISMTQLSETEEERRASEEAKTAAMSHNQRRNVANMILTLAVAFFICWTPQQTTLIWDAFRDKNKKPKGVAVFKYIALYLAFSSSAVHPIVYMIFNKCFRSAAWQCLRFWRRRNHSVFTVHPSTSEESP